MPDGFVTLGRTELLLALIAVSLLMVLVGYLIAQVVAMIRRPAVVKTQACPMPHCDDTGQMNKWLRERDFSLITNEILADLQTRILPRPMILPPPDDIAWPSAEFIEELEAAIKRHPAGRHRKADGNV